MSSGRRQRGFTYLAALFLVGIAGIGLAATAEIWSHARQREKEAELLWIGEQFRQAIGLYYQRTPGTVKRYPERLEDLLEDKRYVNVQRYLRRIYVDPMSAKAEWGLVPAPGGGFMGVYSQSGGKPIRTASLPPDEGTAAHAATYRDWRFTYQPTSGVQSGVQTAKPR
jgi:type II secretory pathway pseudopilin PulG